MPAEFRNPAAQFVVERAAVGQPGQGIGAGLHRVGLDELRLLRQALFRLLESLLEPVVGLDHLLDRAEDLIRVGHGDGCQVVVDAIDLAAVLVDILRHAGRQFLEMHEHQPHAGHLLLVAFQRRLDAAAARAAPGRETAANQNQGDHAAEKRSEHDAPHERWDVSQTRSTKSYSVSACWILMLTISARLARNASTTRGSKCVPRPSFMISKHRSKGNAAL